MHLLTATPNPLAAITHTMKIYLGLISLTLLFASCRNHPNDKKDSIQKIDSGVTSTVIAKDTLHYIGDFENFWKSFRQSVLNSDTNQIIALTQFPFETRGPLDSDPTIKHDKKKFTHVFQSFLKQWNGMDLEGTTELQSIEKTKTIDKKDISDEYTRVGDLVFSKTNAGWKLVFAYLNNDTIDALTQ
jgi:hypothetical protein